MKYYKLFLVLLLCVSLACTKNNDMPDAEPVNILISEAMDLESADMFTQIEILPIEFKENAIIQRIEKVVIRNDSYFFLNRMSNEQEIIIMNSDGLPSFSNNIYHISEDSCFLAFQLVFDKPTIEPGTRISGPDPVEGVYNRSVMENEEFLMVSFLFSGKVYWSFYNKREKTLKTVINPWNESTKRGYLLSNKCLKGNQVILETTNIDIHELFSKIDPDGTKLLNPEILDTIDPESETTNPFLVFAKLQITK